jgi:hypothetical protein
MEWSDGGAAVSWRAVALVRYWCKMMASQCIGVGAR